MIGVLLQVSDDAAAVAADRAAVEGWIRARGLDPARAAWFEEPATDAWTPAAKGGRTRAKALLDDVEAGRLKVVVVADLAHVATAAGDILRIVDRIVTAGGTFASVRPRYDTAAPGGAVVRNWTRAVLDAESRQRVLRSRNGKILKGSWRRGRPSHLWTDQDQELYDSWRRRGISIYAIAQRGLCSARYANGRESHPGERWYVRRAEPRWRARQAAEAAARDARNQTDSVKP